MLDGGVKNGVTLKSEKEVSEDIQKAAAKHRCKLFRNNSGAFTDSRGIPVRFGLGNTSKKINSVFKTSDYVGYKIIEVTPEMVGTTLAVFTALEIKESGWKYTGTDREVAQKKFIDVVNEDGGIAGFADSIESANNIILCTKRCN